MIDDYDEESLAFRFQLLKNWINQYESLSSSFSNQLEKNIHRLRLASYLNAEEKNYVYHTQSYVFSLTRNIKSLIVNFQLFDGEEAYFHYDNVTVKTYESKFVFKGELYITNTRIIFSDEIYVHWLNIDNINRIYNHKNNIFVHYLDKIIYFSFPDHRLFELSFKKVCSLSKRQIVYG